MNHDIPDAVTQARAPSTTRSWWRRETYLLRLELWLDDRIDHRTRRSILREVRGNLVVDSADRGIEQALTSLGSARELARSYEAATDSRRGPRWSLAAVWFLGVLMIWWTIALSYSLGMLAVLSSTGTREADSVLLGVPVTVFSGPDGIGIGWRADSVEHFWPLILAVAAAIVTGRLWRIWARPAR
ncbi:hypothetical protein JF66_10450 [Cryobacterium sp. MLB-32]|uniref:HAAS signaling domain-containing protein n=1 Tax=Cryobacterium sp. MLB-32 TaxID=1529318 RepID=UPI0004E642CC|nr:hypothetical protein [Cryobacterium sp. MLB-32]KFF59560.1 hypothetical protein JF66_10450 [Cryobacterium sp. MLB-32]